MFKYHDYQGEEENKQGWQYQAYVLIIFHHFIAGAYFDCSFI